MSSTPRKDGVFPGTQYPVRMDGLGAVTSDGKRLRHGIKYATKIKPRGSRGRRHAGR